MHPDVKDLMAFYASPLGAMVRRLLTHRIAARWRKSSVRGESVLGLGFATPYLGLFRRHAGRLGALMPAGQGVLAWPREGPYQSLLVGEEHLPLADASVDRLLAVHSLEFSERARALLREIWRVLAPEGRLLLLVPNRRGLWSRSDRTPFGHGRPFSRAQLRALLSDVLLDILEIAPALHVPPVPLGPLARSAATIERLGAGLWPALCGVFIVEARKLLHAPIGGEAVAERQLVFADARLGSWGIRGSG